MSHGICELIIGHGEIGTALGNVIGKVDFRDMNEFPPDAVYDIIHICFPYSDTFVEQVLAYIGEYRPISCIIHGTVMPGTTRQINDATDDCLVAYSPVRGRHGQLERDLLEFVKYVGSNQKQAAEEAAYALISAGMTVRIASCAAVLELGKLFQTSYTGVLIAWAQEMERYCTAVGVEYMEAMNACEMPNTPRCIHLPGHIGGHCIMPNLDFLDDIMPDGRFTSAIRESNEMVDDVRLEPGQRLLPIPYRQNV